MKAITYRNTKTTIPGWVNTIHLDNSSGYAYEMGSHFVHFYGADKGFHGISIGLTATEKKHGTLEEWVKKTFGAEDIKEVLLEVGESVEGVWRPSLYFNDDTFQALNVSQSEMRNVEQALRILIDRLDELFLYIEPTPNGLQTYSHKTRELLILACTEVENLWKYYFTKTLTPPLNGRTYTTKDYVKLVDKLYLKEYKLKLRTHSSVPPIIPFQEWNSISPTTSLNWYDSYNKTKHDRDTYFADATLLACIYAIAANLVLYSVRFSPFPLFDQQTTFSSLINQHFDIELVNTSHQSYYLYDLNLPEDMRSELICFNAKKAGLTKPFKVNPLQV